MTKNNKKAYRKKRSWKPLVGFLTGVTLATVFNLTNKNDIDPEHEKPDVPLNKVMHIIDKEDIALMPGPTLLINTNGDEYDALLTMPHSIRSLNDNEKALATRIFGDSINLEDIILVFYNNNEHALESNVLLGDTRYIRFYLEEDMSDDYSNEENPELFGSFVYHLTQIWQHQNNWEFTNNTADEENYTVGFNSQLTQFGPNTQAMILEDYSRRFLHEDYKTKRHYNLAGSSIYTDQNCTADENIARIVEGHFSNARNARYSHLETRFLTDNELYFVSTFFDGAVDPTLVVNHFWPQECSANGKNTLATVPGGTHSDINYWGAPYHSDDYTLDSSTNLGIFGHEIVHIWQNQTDDLHTNETFVNTPDKYAYPIDNETYSFENYSTEQQGAIIEDYISYYLHADKTTKRLEMTEEKLKGLKKLVEDYFPGAKTLRENFEQHGTIIPQKQINPFQSSTRQQTPS
jgi:hypothetical protein